MYNPTRRNSIKDLDFFGQVKKKLKFNDHVKPIRLHEPGTRLRPGTKITVIGFGRTEVMHYYILIYL